MRWLRRLMGLPLPEDEAQRIADRQALEKLHTELAEVHKVASPLKRELLRVNEQLRQRSPR